jgi:hypothetical protein
MSLREEIPRLVERYCAGTYASRPFVAGENGGRARGSLAQ